MRVKKCYIDHFGKLSCFSYSFSDGLNVICQENGWGKSTFAAFIKAMFYGMEQTTKRSLSENERKKYEPWQGGAYGGNIEFEANGREYRIERFFGSKDKEDTFTCYDLNTGLISTQFSEKIGEELFGVDRDAFERSLFMKQERTAISLTDSIAAKLGGLMNSGDDLDCYEQAYGKLDAEKKLYLRIGERGKIPEKKAQIATIQSRIQGRSGIAESLDLYRKRIEEQKEKENSMEKERLSIRERMQRAGEAKAYGEKKRRYQQLLTNWNQMEEEMKPFLTFFTHKVPDLQELEKMREYEVLSRSNVKTEKQDEEVFISRFPQLAEVVREHPITDRELDACVAQSKEVQERTENAREKEYRKEQTEKEWNERIQETEKISLVLPTFISILCAIGSVILFLFLPFYYGMVGSVLTVFSIVWLINSINRRKRSRHAAKSAENNYKDAEAVYQRDLEELRAKEGGIRAFLQPYRTQENLSDSDLIGQLREVNAEFRSFARQQEEGKNYLRKKDEERTRLANIVTQFIKEYPVNQESDAEEALREIAQKREAFLYKKKESTSKLLELKEAKEELEKEKPNQEEKTVEELQQKEEELQQLQKGIQEETKQITQTLEQFEQQISQNEEDEQEKQFLEEELVDYEHKYRLLDKTMKYLKASKEEFSGRYLRKINENFQYYSKLLSEDEYNTTQLDVKLSIKTEKFGTRREMGYFSTGSREAMELCARFALADALFEKEEPFYILDDPFVNLDEEKLQQAKNILNIIAQKKQIIYFVCHSSRE